MAVFLARGPRQTMTTSSQWRGERDGLGDVISYISQLGLQDITDIQSKAQTSNKTANTVLSDHEFALALFAEEAEGLLNIARERRTDNYAAPRSILEELEELEEDARYDHLVALAISEGRPIPPRPARIRRFVEPEPELLFAEPEELSEDSDSDSDISVDEREFLLTALRSVFDVHPEEPASSSSSSRSSYVEPAKAVESCTICGDDADDYYTAPCKHAFHVGCLEHMFRMAIRDESLFPPKCCQQIVPTAQARLYLDASLMSDFEKKSIEFSTPDRVYCHKPKCSAFLGPTNTETIASLRCTECAAETCSSCKESAHAGRKCADRADLNDIAKQMHDRVGWQRCPSCSHLVEKSDGCHHIICLCHAQFCYLCATPWKQCDCPRFDVPPET